MNGSGSSREAIVPEDEDDLPLFADEDVADPVPSEAQRVEGATTATPRAPTEAAGRAWKVLVADDDPHLHAVTRMVLAGATFRDRPIQVEVAASARDAVAALARSPDIALVLLDVVMETDDAGLGAVRAIREELGNRDVRIVLRTGQPGLAPERDVVLRHEIDGYEAKDSLSAQKLLTVVIASLRAFDHIRTLQAQRRGLEQVIDATTRVLRSRSLEAFAGGVLAQLEGLLGPLQSQSSDIEGRDGIFCAHLTPSQDADVTAATILAGSGAFAGRCGERVGALPESARIAHALADAARQRAPVVVAQPGLQGLALALQTDHGRLALAWIGTPLAPEAALLDLVRRFASQLSAAWDMMTDLSSA
jgi:CheY-like chemotaxis protein